MRSFQARARALARLGVIVNKGKERLNLASASSSSSSSPSFLQLLPCLVEMSLRVQRGLSKNLAVSASFLGARGVYCCGYAVFSLLFFTATAVASRSKDSFV